MNAWLKIRFGVSKRINLYERLQSYVEEGYPIVDTLIKFKARYAKKNDFRGKIIDIWLTRMKSGASFSKAIEGWVPEAELNLISSGETGEGIALGLKEAVRFTQAAQKIKSTIIAGSAYPTILFLLVMIFIAAFSKYMAPTFIQIMPVAKWPEGAKTLYSFSSFINNNWLYCGVGFITLAVTISYTLDKWIVGGRKIADKFPPWTIYKSYQAAAFLISLSSMMKSGVALNDALKKMNKTASPWFSYYINKMLLNLKKGGENYGKHLDVGLMDEETAGDVIDYSDLGKFEKAIYSIGEKSIDESVTKIAIQMAVAKNLMLVLLAVTVGWIYFTSTDLNSTIADAAASSQSSMIKDKN